MTVALSRRNTQNYDNIGIIEIIFLWEHPPRLQIMEFMLPLFVFKSLTSFIFCFSESQVGEFKLVILFLFSSTRQPAKWFVLVVIEKEFIYEAGRAGLRPCTSVPAMESWLHPHLPGQLVLTGLQGQRHLGHMTCACTVSRAGWWKRSFWRRLLGLVTYSMS